MLGDMRQTYKWSIAYSVKSVVKDLWHDCCSRSRSLSSDIDGFVWHHRSVLAGYIISVAKT
jgi:hypothetical protein